MARYGLEGEDGAASEAFGRGMRLLERQKRMAERERRESMTGFTEADRYGGMCQLMLCMFLHADVTVDGRPAGKGLGELVRDL